MYKWALKVVFAVLLIYLIIILMWSKNDEKKIPKRPRNVQSASAPENSEDFAAILKARELREKNEKCAFLSVDPFDDMRTGNILFMYSFGFSVSKFLKRPFVVRKISLLHGNFGVSAPLISQEEYEKFEPIYFLYEKKENFSLIPLRWRIRNAKFFQKNI